mmetsp:Transcript_15355/g.33612  ORF Transcript_15355/g.33612 Transcript_15355/m.33612 type:complete len:120 (-) Transcript_15355:863-1222(-)
MGKLINESRFVAQKSADCCKWFADNLLDLEKPQVIESNAKLSYIKRLPMGPIFCIIPSNFPFWLTFKTIVPKIALGNTILMKNADICPRMSTKIEELFIEAGYTNNEFQSLLISPEQTE